MNDRRVAGIVLITGFLSLFSLNCIDDSSDGRHPYEYIVPVDTIVMSDTISYSDTLEVRLFGLVGTSGCFSFERFEV